mgnify:FL=1
MSFTYINDFTNTKENASNVEVNSMIKNNLKHVNKEKAEIFSKIVWGKDTSKYGKKVDTVMDGVKNLASAAKDGDTKAKAEINTITTVTLQQPLMQRLQVNNMLGNVTNVGMDEQLNYQYYQLQGSELSRIQASSGSFTFPSVKKRTKTAETKTATGGLVVDLREMASGATDGFAVAGEQVITDMTNQMVLSNVTTLTSGIKNAATLKNYAAGITATNVDKVRSKARRFGRVTIIGDVDVVEKMNDLAGFNIHSATSTEVRFPESVMQEIMATGLLSEYKGSPVVELPNSYNFTQLNTDKDFYKLYLPTTDLWFIPQGNLTPLQIVMRSGITSMTVQDINTRSEVTRFDIEYGNALLAEYIPFIGYIYDEASAE